MSGEEDKKKRRGRRTTLARLTEGGVIVALITAAFGFVGVWFTSDVRRCEIATGFLVDFAVRPLYTEQETERLKALYIGIAEADCPGD